MGSYLNPNGWRYAQIAHCQVFIDKSALLTSLNKRVGENKNFLCVTMPSGFGKSYLVQMISAYYSKGADSAAVFDAFDVSKDASYKKHLNKHNVISIDISSLCSSEKGTDVISYVNKRVGPELSAAFPDVDLSGDLTFADKVLKVFEQTGERFIIVIDEWDYLLRNYPDNVELFDDYIRSSKPCSKARRRSRPLSSPT